MTKKLLTAIVLLGTSVTVLATTRNVRGSAAPACRVQGVWELVASVQSGKRTEFTGARERKIVTKKHWMWLSATSRRDTLPLRTPLDSARVYSVFGGSGTYDISGHRYTEHIDLFVDPRLQEKSLTASCRITGNQWYHTYLTSDLNSPVSGAAARASTDSITEIWRRVE